MTAFSIGIDLLIDADTVWTSADVYAVLYLSLDGGPWNEYAVTEDFRIAGARAEDEYVIVTELQSGYPSGDYDLLIELFSTDSGEFLADFGPEANSDLGFLPLEDFNRDAPAFDTPVTVSRRSGGGSTGCVRLVADRRRSGQAGLRGGCGFASRRRAVRITLRPHAASVSKYA